MERPARRGHDGHARSVLALDRRTQARVQGAAVRGRRVLEFWLPRLPAQFRCMFEIIRDDIAALNDGDTDNRKAAKKLIKRAKLRATQGQIAVIDKCGEEHHGGGSERQHLPLPGEHQGRPALEGLAPHQPHRD
jgi:hypothetical protein